jgi:hypothetical protein
VLYIRVQAARVYATFDLVLYYTVGSATGDVREVTLDDHGQPFRVTGMPLGAKPQTVSYQEAFNMVENNEGMELCPVADPSLIPMGVTAQIRCQP